MHRLDEFHELHPKSGNTEINVDRDHEDTIATISHLRDNFRCHNGYAMAKYRSNDMTSKLKTDAPTKVNNSTLRNKHVSLFLRISGNPKADISYGRNINPNNRSDAAKFAIRM